MTDQKTAAVFGLGSMGYGIASSIPKAGHKTYGFDIARAHVRLRRCIVGPLQQFLGGFWLPNKRIGLIAWARGCPCPWSVSSVSFRELPYRFDFPGSRRCRCQQIADLFAGAGSRVCRCQAIRQLVANHLSPPLIIIAVDLQPSKPPPQPIGDSRRNHVRVLT